MTRKTVLKAGTVVYHGTDCDDFDEAEDGLDGPAWVSSSKAVADWFLKNRAGWGGRKRIISYVLAEDLELYEITSSRAMQDLAAEFDLDLNGVEAIRESVERAGLPGWIIPNNYPNGDDILIVDTGVLEYQGSEPVDEPAPRQI
jgi:hypothetical protein